MKFAIKHEYGRQRLDKLKEQTLLKPNITSDFLVGMSDLVHL